MGLSVVGSKILRCFYGVGLFLCVRVEFSVIRIKLRCREEVVEGSR